MYYLCTDQKDAGRIKDPEQKYDKSGQGAVYRPKFYNGTDVPREDVFCNLEEYRRKKSTVECVRQLDLHFREKDIQNGDREENHEKRDYILYQEACDKTYTKVREYMPHCFEKRDQ